MIKKILVTGSSGTIGTRLCERLIDEGYEVYGVDKKKNKWHQHIQKRTTVVDLCNKAKSLKVLPKDVDLVIHLAANARVHDLVVDPSKAEENMVMTHTVLEHVRQNGIKRLIFSSSREVYGNRDQYIHKEDNISVVHCASPYTASKISCESNVWAYHRCYGIDFITFRFSNVYGMYDESDRIVPLFIELARANKDLTVYGREKILDFTYIDDTVDGVIMGIRQFEKTKNKVYNLADGKGTSLIDVAQTMKKLLKSKSKIVVKKSRIGEVMRYVADIKNAKATFGYKPKVLVEDGLTRSVAWYTENGIR